MIWDAMLLCSVVWVCHRLYKLNMVPREILEERLGYDIPPAPEVSIAGMKSRSVLLYWLNSRENSFFAVTLSVLVNGIKVGVFSRGETSIEILNLKPDCCYNIKILATNSANLTTMSPVIRIQTRQETATDIDVGEGNTNEPASIRTSVSPSGSQVTHVSVKDNGSLPQVSTKNSSTRRNTPIGHSSEVTVCQTLSSSDSDEDDSPDTIRRLTEKMESFKRQKAEIDKQIEDEEAEIKVYHVDLATERDHLKQELKEKEEASVELKRHGNHLDKLNRTAQSKKAARERLLQQKRAERQRIKDDSERWDHETIEILNNIEELDRELEFIKAARDKETGVFRLGIVEDQDFIKSLEEEIRVIGAQIKELEQRREQMHTEIGHDHAQAKADRERDEAWELRHQHIQTQLTTMWQALQQAKLEEQGAEEQLSWWLARHARNPEHFVPVPALDRPSTVQRNRSKRSRQAISRGSNLSVPGYYGGSLNHGVAPPPSSSGSSLFSPGNAITGTHGINPGSLSQTDVETLTGGAAMSPAANELLPSNLFRDEDISVQHSSAAGGETAGIEHFLGHAISYSDASVPGPNTPVSASSHGSVFASPHDSMHNLSAFPLDSDRQSINSTNASLPQFLNTDSASQATSRFASIFSSPFSRQRGKTTAQDPPLLGTLKQGQSQSFPRNIEQEAFDDAGVRRRRGSHGNWAKPMAGLLARNNGNLEAGFIRARTGSGRSSRLNMFKPRMEVLDHDAITENELSSSRPSSTYSFDQPLRRPSSESQRIWGLLPDSTPNRGSPLGANWASSHGPWTNGPSRRSSVQHGSTTNLSIGSTPLDADDMSRSLSNYRSEQAPIGTRPPSQRASTPKLNPTAPSFKMLFSRSEAKRAVKYDKAGSRHSEFTKETDSERGGTDGTDSIEDASPPHPRHSRDAQSITTATSTADSHDSFERTTSGIVPDAITPSGHKESLMQKISRKSSSSKFNVPWSKDRGIFSKRAGESLTPSEIDGDSAREGQPGKNADSATSTPHTPQDKTGRAWPSMRRKSKKGDMLERGGDLGDEEE